MTPEQAREQAVTYEKISPASPLVVLDYAQRRLSEILQQQAKTVGTAKGGWRSERSPGAETQWSADAGRRRDLRPPKGGVTPAASPIEEQVGRWM